MKNLNLSGFLILFCTLLSGCLHAPERNFSDADLLIDASEMPDRWAVRNSIDATEDEEGQASGAEIIFYVVDTPYFARSGERVYRYTSEQRAAWHYERIRNTYFNDNRASLTTPWTIPEGFTFVSVLADQWRFGCAGASFSPVPEMGANSTNCIYLAQYQEFLVFFTITTEVDADVMIDTEDIVRIVKAMDARMDQYLSR